MARTSRVPRCWCGAKYGLQAQTITTKILSVVMKPDGALGIGRVLISYKPQYDGAVDPWLVCLAEPGTHDPQKTIDDWNRGWRPTPPDNGGTT